VLFVIDRLDEQVDRVRMEFMSVAGNPMWMRIQMLQRHPDGLSSLITQHEVDVSDMVGVPCERTMEISVQCSGSPSADEGSSVTVSPTHLSFVLKSSLLSDVRCLATYPCEMRIHLLLYHLGVVSRITLQRKVRYAATWLPASTLAEGTPAGANWFSA
jgi:hypothetical protein